MVERERRERSTCRHHSLYIQKLLNQLNQCSCNTIVADDKYSHPYMASLAAVHALEVIQVFPQPGQNPLWMMTKVDAPWEMSNITQS